MDNNKSTASISKKSFIIAIAILFILMIITYSLTFIIPSGSYERNIIDGREIVIPNTYTTTNGSIPFYKWILSPILVLFSSGNITIIAIIFFLLIIAGVFSSLENCGILKYMLSKIYNKYSEKKYKLLYIISLFFMCLGSFVGSFEECVPLVPIAVSLALAMGWDELTGLGMSLLSIGCGFATGILNPFTVGVAQELISLPMFSGISFRIISFIIIYIVLIVFLLNHAKKAEKERITNEKLESIIYNKNSKMDKGLLAFIIVLSIGIIIILCSSFIPFLQGILMPIIALIFLISGISSVLLSGVKFNEFTKTFISGVVMILPAILLILMASSIKYTMVESQIMDTILYNSIKIIEQTPVEISILLIYFLILGMNFFIASGSAKAFLLIPLIAPLVDLAGISRQTAILAFAYGDGFSNLFYATNSVLLISLGLANISYGKWIKFTYKFQIIILFITSIMLLIAHYVGY